jgi:hypothetical protein
MTPLDIASMYSERVRVMLTPARIVTAGHRTALQALEAAGVPEHLGQALADAIDVDTPAAYVGLTVLRRDGAQLTGPAWEHDAASEVLVVVAAERDGFSVASGLLRYSRPCEAEMQALLDDFARVAPGTRWVVLQRAAVVGFDVPAGLLQ